MAPPTKAPRLETQSNVVAVPRSMTMHGEPCRARPASALAMRSGPTVSGSVTSSGIGESRGVTSSVARPVTARSASVHGPVSAGTTEHSTLAAPAAPRGSMPVSARRSSGAVEAADHGVRVPHVHREQRGRGTPLAGLRSSGCTARAHDQPSSRSRAWRRLATRNDSPTLRK